MKNIRNFCIIAHIDHGKSTLADRLLEMTKTRTARELQAQVLDDMELSGEGDHHQEPCDPDGVCLSGREVRAEPDRYPGHVDFSYEVSRAIASCEGALLVVDATQGIQAQTISNLYLALEHDLEIIPVLNKIDMDAAMVDEVKDQIVDLLGCDPDSILAASGKTGQGVEEVLGAIIERIPAPQGDPQAPLQALIFDSVFNPFRGIIAYYRIFNGSLRKGERVAVQYRQRIFGRRSGRTETQDGSARHDEYRRRGDILFPGSKPLPTSRSAIRSLRLPIRARKPSPGFEDVKPMVFCGTLPGRDRPVRRPARFARKLNLNDASLTYEPESSLALGFGFRCGFLGLLHMEIIQERLYREFNMDVITTVPNVSYKVHTSKGEVIDVHNPSGLPELR